MSLGSALKGLRAAEVPAHNREIRESCHRDSGSSTFAKNLSSSPQMPRSLVLIKMHGLPFVSWKDKCVRTRSEVVACP